MDTYGLVGYPLKHSFSMDFFNEKFQNENIAAEYLNFEIPSISLFQDIIAENATLRGLNVTIPYKEKVISFLDEISEEARKIGAVNVICVTRRHGAPFLKGYNTDVIGFMQSIEPLLESHHKKALILGTGGASKAVNYGLVGMFPHTEECPDIPYDQIGPDHLLYDLIYNPDETLFLKKGKANGAITKNGLEMLILQAYAGWDLWTHEK